VDPAIVVELLVILLIHGHNLILVSVLTVVVAARARARTRRGVVGPAPPGGAADANSALACASRPSRLQAPDARRIDCFSMLPLACACGRRRTVRSDVAAARCASRRLRPCPSAPRAVGSRDAKGWLARAPRSVSGLRDGGRATLCTRTVCWTTLLRQAAARAGRRASRRRHAALIAACPKGKVGEPTIGAVPIAEAVLQAPPRTRRRRPAARTTAVPSSALSSSAFASTSLACTFVTSAALQELQELHPQGCILAAAALAVGTTPHRRPDGTGTLSGMVAAQQVLRVHKPEERTRLAAGPARAPMPGWFA
jgi:hypothetical protein